MEEIWKDIPGYEGIYQVSDQGRVRSLDHYVRNKHNTLSLRRGKILKICRFGVDYVGVDLSKESKRHSYTIHSLVWRAFNGPIPEGMQINHINERKTDCRLENLNLMTPKENINWGTMQERRVITRKKKDNYGQIPIKQIDADGMVVRVWESASAVEKAYGWDQSHICACCMGKQITSYNYRWEYALT